MRILFSPTVFVPFFEAESVVSARNEMRLLVYSSRCRVTGG